MKQLLLPFLFFCCCSINGQELSKKEFNEIFLESGKVLNYILNGEVDKIGELLQIKDLDNFKDFERIFTEQKIPFNSKSDHTYAHPFFYLSDTENILDLTIPGVMVLERRAGEDYERSEYYFILKAQVIYDWESEEVSFKNAGILTEEKDFEQWWLRQFDSYLSEVKKVSDRFGFTPPPPSCPPKNLKP